MHYKATPLFLMTLLTGLMIYILKEHTLSGPDEVESTNTARANVSSVITAADFRQYHPSGKLAAHIQSQRATHYTDSNSIEFERPFIKLYPAQASGWTDLESQSGLWWLDQQILTLTGNIVLTQQDDQSEPVTVMKTERLSYRQIENFISTDQAVTITRGQAQIRAVGLNADLEKKRMTLLSDVRGRYEPTP